MLKRRGRPIFILEKDPRTLKKDEMKYYYLQEKARECLASVDYLLIVTGTILINKTL